MATSKNVAATTAAPSAETQALLAALQGISNQLASFDSRISALENAVNAKVVSTQVVDPATKARTAAYAVVEKWVQAHYPDHDVRDVMLAMSSDLATARKAGSNPPYAIWFCEKDADGAPLMPPVVRYRTLNTTLWASDAAGPKVLDTCALWLRENMSDEPIHL